MRLNCEARESFEMKTRDRILEAACREFAALGFRETTIAAICRSAGANIASVNYYFGSKEKLYEAVWEYADRRTREIYPAEEPDGNPEEWLRHYIRDLFLMIFDEGPGGWLPRLIRRDVDEEREGELLKKIRIRFLEPRRRRLEAAVGAILNITPDSFAVRSVTGHIQAVGLFFNRKMRFREHIFNRARPDRGEAEFIIRSMQEFVEGGIERVQSALAAGRLNEKSLGESA